MSDFNETPIQNPQSEENKPEVSQTPPPVQAPPVTSSSMFGDSSDFNSYDDIQEKPKNNMTIAIIATIASLFTACCGYVSCIGVILGIIAIVFSTQVDTKYRNGDFEGAQSSAKNAKLLSMIAFGTVVVSIVYIIILLATGGAMEFMDEFNRQMATQGY